ncbi:MAG: helix-turn-helix transcriptional regulator [Alkalibacterium sp.]|nr:helix-turn-helix transcriptional regulator [Alkalibacterium sp.]
MALEDREFAYYNKHDELVMTGTLEEIGYELGVKPSTVHFYTSQVYRNRTKRGIRVVDISDGHKRINTANLAKLKQKKEERGYTLKELGEVLNVSEHSFSRKMEGYIRFTKDEIRELEDLFFLEEGELIKGEE